MKFENIEVFNIKGALRGMRNPKDSWGKSDSYFKKNCEMSDGKVFIIGKNDMKLAKTLINAGGEHRKFLRQIMITMDITAPRYFWAEYDTYKVGTTSNSCSTMHTIHKKPLCRSNFYLGESPQHGTEIVIDSIISIINYLSTMYEVTKDYSYIIEIKRLLPESFMQKRTITMNYENALNIYKQRKNHRLKEEWGALVKEFEKLPYFHEFFVDK